MPFCIHPVRAVQKRDEVTEWEFFGDRALSIDP